MKETMKNFQTKNVTKCSLSFGLIGNFNLHHKACIHICMLNFICMLVWKTMETFETIFFIIYCLKRSYSEFKFYTGSILHNQMSWFSSHSCLLPSENPDSDWIDARYPLKAFNNVKKI